MPSNTATKISTIFRDRVITELIYLLISAAMVSMMFRRLIWIHFFYHFLAIRLYHEFLSQLNSSWPHAFARIMARERRAAHGPNSRDCWSPGEPARVQPPFPQDIWTLSCSVIRLALIGAGVLARIWFISNNYPYQNNIKTTFSPWISRYKCSISIRHRITEWPTCNLQGYSIAEVSFQYSTYYSSD